MLFRPGSVGPMVHSWTSSTPWTASDCSEGDNGEACAEAGKIKQMSRLTFSRAGVRNVHNSNRNSCNCKAELELSLFFDGNVIISCA